MFNSTKLEYEQALIKCWHTTKLTYTPPNHEQNNVRRTWQLKIVWFKPPFNLDVSNKVAKIFLNLIEKHFSHSSKLHKIFNKNTVKVSYSCTRIKGHNKKIVQKETQETLECNCRVKTDCPLNGDCNKENVIYKCTATTCISKKVYLGLIEGEFKKQRYYGHVKSFKNKFYANSTTLSSYVWEMIKRKNVALALTWEVLRTAKTYSNLTKRCSLCLHKKLAIITYPYPDELLNRRSELVTKCKHENKFLLKNFNSYDWSFEPYDNLRKYNINDISNGFILLTFSAWVIRQEQNKDIFKLIRKCLCFAFVESFRRWMSAKWIFSEYRL